MTRASTTEASGRRLCLRQPADPSQLAPLRRRVHRWAVRNGVPADAVIDLQLALGEAVANGIDHAYRDGANGTIEIELELRPGAPGPVVDVPVVVVRVVDHGRWRPAPGSSSYRGRGLAMIGRLARDLRVATSGAGTQLTFAIPLGR